MPAISSCSPAEQARVGQTGAGHRCSPHRKPRVHPALSRLVFPESDSLGTRRIPVDLPERPADLRARSERLPGPLHGGAIWKMRALYFRQRGMGEESARPLPHVPAALAGEPGDSERRPKRPHWAASRAAADASDLSWCRGPYAFAASSCQSSRRASLLCLCWPIGYGERPACAA